MAIYCRNIFKILSTETTHVKNDGVIGNIILLSLINCISIFYYYEKVREKKTNELNKTSRDLEKAVKKEKLMNGCP